MVIVKLTMNGKPILTLIAESAITYLRLLQSREDFDADIALFDAIMALHEDFRDAIGAFRKAPDGLSSFLRVVSHFALHLCAYMH